MRQRLWPYTLGLGLVALSGALYYLHYWCFRDVHHIFIYLLGDIAFIPIQVLLVTLIIEKLLSDREKQLMLNKLNMVIGAFFSEVGRDLLKRLTAFDANAARLREDLRSIRDWSGRQFDEAALRHRRTEGKLDATLGALPELRDVLVRKRLFLLALLENPSLLEHESFSELLWAVFHLTEELAERKNVAGLAELDGKHVSGDMDRAYGLLVSEWVGYMKHLKRDYPYLFSLAARLNPFDENAAAEVRS